MIHHCAAGLPFFLLGVLQQKSRGGGGTTMASSSHLRPDLFVVVPYAERHLTPPPSLLLRHHTRSASWMAFPVAIAPGLVDPTAVAPTISVIVNRGRTHKPLAR